MDILYWIVGILLVVAIVLTLRPIRRLLISQFIMKILAKVLPQMSDTERIALEAGTVWWDGELFSGKPNWQKLLDFKVQPLSTKEKDFIRGPVEDLCQKLNEWTISQDRRLSDEIWDFLKAKKFFGMIIPEKYGGLGFSAQAHSEVITKLASRSLSATVVTMVPNSLGPAELLLHYGTDEQKNYYLPRLAQGKEIPCFALTEPTAGSDAASGKSKGVICRGSFNGQEVLGMKLTWDKRYITLAPVGTLIGLAFRLYDPEHLLGDKDDLGITCALIPVGTPGVEIGRLHDPVGSPFPNGPTTGKDVFVPLDFIIGGPKNAGRGWEMLMQSLAAGRSISLPSQSTGGAQLCSRSVSAYSVVRDQFSTPIGKFEGVEELIGRMAGFTYLLNAARKLTAGAVDAGEKPSVVSAIVKAYSTEIQRVIVNDAMDIHGGSGISKGPRNALKNAYTSVPIGITVEGANILTRSLIIFGQGAIRCHPFVEKEMAAIGKRDLVAFDKAFFGHLWFVCRNFVRAKGYAYTGSAFVGCPQIPELKYYFKQLTRISTAFAVWTDVAMGILGGDLKRKERLSSRFADILAWMYLASAALKLYVDEGRQKKDLPFVNWCCDYALYQISISFKGLFQNFPNRLVATMVRLATFPFGICYRPPSDRLNAKLSRGLLYDDELRNRLTAQSFMPPLEEFGLGRLEWARKKVLAAADVGTKLKLAVKEKRLDKRPKDTLLKRALSTDVISQTEFDSIAEAEQARDEVIQVDAFDPKTYYELR